MGRVQDVAPDMLEVCQLLVQADDLCDEGAYAWVDMLAKAIIKARQVMKSIAILPEGE